MPCYHPLKAYRPLSRVDGGRYVFNSAKALNPDHPVGLPCGQCIGCRQDIAEGWAISCYHESLTQPCSSFLTLTFADEHLPDDYSVSLRDVQLFMKRLRKALGHKVKFFAASEYGSDKFRPHYHILLFGADFRGDRQLFKVTEQGPLYTSQKLSDAWQNKGFCTVGSVTMNSALYCIQYVFDVRGGDLAPGRYERIHPVTGQPVRCAREFRTMSNGIAADYIKKHRDQLLAAPFIVVDGKQYAVPRRYLQLISEEDKKQLRKLKLRKDFNDRFTLRVRERKHNRSKERLAVREEIHQRKLNQRKTSL